MFRPNHAPLPLTARLALIAAGGSLAVSGCTKPAMAPSNPYLAYQFNIGAAVSADVPKIEAIADTNHQSALYGYRAFTVKTNKPGAVYTISLATDGHPTSTPNPNASPAVKDIGTVSAIDVKFTDGKILKEFSASTAEYSDGNGNETSQWALDQTQVPATAASVAAAINLGDELLSYAQSASVPPDM